MGSGLVVAFIAVVPVMMAAGLMLWRVFPSRLEAAGIAVGLGQHQHPAQADGEAPAPGPEAEEDAPEVPEEGLGGAGTEDGEDSGEDTGEGAARIGDDGGETTPLDGGETGDVTAGDVDGDADEAPGADRTGEAAPDGEPNETEDAADGEAE